MLRFSDSFLSPTLAPPKTLFFSSPREPHETWQMKRSASLRVSRSARKRERERQKKERRRAQNSTSQPLLDLFKKTSSQTATIAKLARDAAAPILAGTSARVSGDAVDATLACADEFVRLVYAEGRGKGLHFSIFRVFSLSLSLSFFKLSLSPHPSSSFNNDNNDKQPSRPPTPPKSPRCSPTTSWRPSPTSASTNRSCR